MNRFVEVLLAALGLSFITSYVAAILAQQPVPTLIEITFGLFPFLALAAVVSFVILLMSGKEKSQSASVYVTTLAGIACAIGLVASLFRVWNDGSYYTLLTPVWSGISIASLGFLPVKMGPFVLVRFLPILFAIGIFLRIRRATHWGRGILLALGSYLFLALSIHALTWIGGAISMTHGETLQSPGDTFRVLVSAQADGYWTRAQAERFFAPPGRQSDISFFGIHAAVEFLLLFLIGVLFAVRSIRSVSLLFRRLISREMGMLLTVPFLGIAIGFVLHPISAFSYSDVLAVIVFVCVFVAWLLWWRLTQDIQQLAVHEREQPNLPLPSGAVSVSDAEALSRVSLALSFFGALVLGWPVLLAFLTATAVPYVRSWMTFQNKTRQIIGESVALIFLAGILGFAALAVMLRDAIAAQWMFQFLFAAAFLVGFNEAFLHIELFTVSRLWQAVIAAVSVAFALLLANQRATWLLFLPAIALVFIFARTPESWRKFRQVPLYFVLAGVILIALIIPDWIQRG